MKAIILFTILIHSGSIFGQQLIGSAGGSSSSTAAQMSWSVGEALVGMSEGSGHSIAVGFQQPTFAIPTRIVPDLQFTLQVYPNPTASLLFVETKEDIGGKFDVNVHDASGRRVEKLEFAPSLNGRLQINAQNWTSGVHVLTIIGKRKKIVAQYKIIKL